jgi:D-glucosaminate-6-phosphate ammonia-lyase
MGIYSDLGLRPVINASGTLTRLGGSRMAPEVLEAMNEAAASFVHIDELQASAGAKIAEMMGAEAAYVVTGAAAGLSLATAACVAGMDIAAMDRLPDTTGLKDEVVVQRGHRNAYDHAIRAVGVRFVEVGYLGYPGAGGTWPWQIAEAITERTAAVACPVLDTRGTVPLREVCAVAHAHGVPVIVDAAAELPPRSNLRRFLVEGADLVVFSGGKAIGGPQASGILAGRADLIASVALQHQDMDVRPETWSRREWLSSGRVGGIPHQGFGRSMKVGREEIVGLLVALQRFVAGSDEADLVRYQGLLDPIEEALHGIIGISVCRHLPAHKPVPSLRIDLSGDDAGTRAYDLVNRLLDGEPAIAIDQSHAEFGRLSITPMGITDDEAVAVARRLREELSASL